MSLFLYGFSWTFPEEFFVVSGQSAEVCETGLDRGGGHSSTQLPFSVVRQQPLPKIMQFAEREVAVRAAGTSYGFFAMQKWPKYGLDFYAGLRRYEVTETALGLEPLLVVPFGVVFNF